MKLCDTMHRVSGFLNEKKISQDSIGTTKVQGTNLVVEMKNYGRVFNKPVEHTLPFETIDQAKQAHTALMKRDGIVFYSRQHGYAPVPTGW